ncbi:MAG: HD domain-containing phosphohydrolase [Syntrophales bacterium]
MERKTEVNFGNLLLSLSEAMDLGSPTQAQHQQRTALAAWEIAKAAGFQADVKERICTAALLHDVGAMSVEEKTAHHLSEFEDVDAHCICGAILLRRSPLLEHTADTVRFHHREWHDWDESIDMPHVMASQIIFLADYLERSIKRDQYILHQHRQIIDDIKSLAGDTIHPQIVDYFLSVSYREEFWLDMVSPRLYSLLLHQGPYRNIDIGLPATAAISDLFRDVIDFRSRFTATHSSGVAAAAEMIARIFGFSEAEVELLKVAGNLHDIGMLAVPNAILEKPDKLTEDEFAIVRCHTYYTYYAIHTIAGLRQIAEWAAYHHEKLDGSGYPFHCKADELNTGARIMAVADMFAALAEDRPYRKSMTKEEAQQTIRKLSSGQLLDGRIVNLLFENYYQVMAYVINKQKAARTFYEAVFSSIAAGPDTTAEQ